MIKKSHVKCPGCGGVLTFDPASNNLLCSNCKKQVKADKILSTDKNPYLPNIENTTKTQKNTNCFSCGAKLDVNEREITKICPYCNNNFVLDSSEIQGLVPDLVIPFKFTKKEAIEKYKSGVKKKFFLPNKFKKSPNFSSIDGTYISAFAFDAFTDTTYYGKISERHTRRGLDGKSETYYISRHISGKKQQQLNNVLVEASSQTQQHYFQEILPYSIDDTTTYKYIPDFIRGYSVETYDTGLTQSKLTSESIMQNTIRRIILSGYSYDRVDYLNLNTTYSDEKYAFMLVPVYFINFEYKRKKYRTYLNGQTGKLGGNLPKSGWKIACSILIPVLIIASIIIGINLIN